MDDDQQFCLRWNNHQSTLVAVFDTLLEHGTLVDCTLAAEGKFLNAHRVVLSACSPYFAALLEKHFDKHPVLILKDVKFQELKAMMDYMYRGEVNISQDQLGALLKAAESLQIKGLSDNKKGETTERKPSPSAPPPKSPQPVSTLPKVQGLTIEQRAREDSREGSMSPGPRKKKRLRRKSEELDNHDASNSSESHSLPAQSIPMLPAITKMNADVPDQIETKSEILTRHKQIDDNIPQVPIIKEKIETHTELMLEPKSEYVDEMNEDSIEDLTLDDDDLSNMEQVDDQAGPSHGAGEGSSQGFGGWHMGNQSQDEVFLAAQEAVGAHRDSQEINQDDLLKLVKCVPFPTISMNRVFKEKRKRYPPKRISEYVENIKQETKTVIQSQKEKPAVKCIQKSQEEKPLVPKKKSIPYYVAYHQNKLGQTLKTLRCKKCSGFISRGQTECKMCFRLRTRKPKLVENLQMESSRKITLKTKKTGFANNISKKKQRSQSKPTKCNSKNSEGKLDIPKLESERTAKKSRSKSICEEPPKLLPFNIKSENHVEEECDNFLTTIDDIDIKPTNLQRTSQKTRHKSTKKKSIKRKRACECVVKEGKIHICKHCAAQTSYSKRSYKSYEPSELFVELEYGNDDNIPEYHEDDENPNIGNVQNIVEVDEHDSDLDLSVGLLENVIDKFERLSESEDEEYNDEEINCRLSDHSYAMLI